MATALLNGSLSLLCREARPSVLSALHALGVKLYPTIKLLWGLPLKYFKRSWILWSSYASPKRFGGALRVQTSWRKP
ncbi:hypothetical protein BDZ89DRAFT_69665 [Hymenopellis radicata]|nr:hypothetical protein BDZ89DRAFT_69665 [Hymenopellis radicata]